jgi:hypothetical protein
VNRILLTTDFEKKANEVIGQGQPGMPGILRGATIT